MRLLTSKNITLFVVASVAFYATPGHSQMTPAQAAYNARVAQAARARQNFQSRMSPAISTPRAARQVVAGGSASNMQSAMSGFAADMGRMPTQAEGLDALIHRPPGAVNWRGPYISTNNFKPAFSDPWGNLYRYIVTPAGNRNIYTIASNGRDGLPNTSDDLTVQF